jgi:hypothetical protein
VYKNGMGKNPSRELEMQQIISTKARLKLGTFIPGNQLKTSEVK